MEDFQLSLSFSKEFETIENILSNDLDENAIKEVDKMTELLETYTQLVNTTNERLERYVMFVSMFLCYLSSSQDT